MHDSRNEDSDLYERMRLQVDAGQSPVRIDKYLMARLASVSRNKIQQAIEHGLITVNGRYVKQNYAVRGSDVIEVALPEPREDFHVTPENIPLQIVFEDEHIIVVDKPAGLVVHPGPGNASGTLVNALLYHFAHLPRPHKGNYRPGLVHRLDKNTSGLLVVAKTDQALEWLGSRFAMHQIERCYVALVWGDMKEDHGTIKGHIGRSLRNRKIMQIFEDGEYGKEAITHYRVMERFYYVTLLECQLETGRTHQIRVQMKHAGHPVFNDPDYGGNRIVKGTVHARYRQFVEGCFDVLPRQALHARLLGFAHPATGQWVRFYSELPADMQEVISRWRHYVEQLK